MGAVEGIAIVFFVGVIGLSIVGLNRCFDKFERHQEHVQTNV